MAKLNL